MKIKVLAEDVTDDQDRGPGRKRGQTGEQYHLVSIECLPDVDRDIRDDEVPGMYAQAMAKWMERHLAPTLAEDRPLGLFMGLDTVETAVRKSDGRMVLLIRLHQAWLPLPEETGVAPAGQQVVA